MTVYFLLPQMTVGPRSCPLFSVELFCLKNILRTPRIRLKWFLSCDKKNKGLPNKVTSFLLKKKRDAILFFIY